MPNVSNNWLLKRIYSLRVYSLKLIFILSISFPALLLSKPVRPIIQNPTKTYSFGLWGGLNYNIHNCDFKSLPGIRSCCPKYESGTGFGFSAGVLFEKYFSEDHGLSIRAGIAQYGADIIFKENVLASLNGEPVNAVFEHRIDARLQSVGADMDLFYKIEHLYDITFSIGFRLAYVYQKTFSQQESILEPADGVYENNERTRLTASGDIPEALNFYGGLVFGISKELPLDDNFSISPELRFNLALTNVSKNLSWKPNSLTIAFAIKYSPSARQEYTKERAKETVVFTPSRNDVDGNLLSVNAYPDDKDVESEKLTTLNVEEFGTIEQRPLLTYIFFNENSTVIAERYKLLGKQAAAGFNVDDLIESGVEDTYYNLLNIVARRMLENPDAKLMIAGYSSSDETNRKSLGLSRANSIQKYMNKIWGISTGRLIVKAALSPPEPSQEFTKHDREENRRVELSSNDWEILAPPTFSGNPTRTNPHVVNFKTENFSHAEVTSWTLEIMQGNRVVDRITGNELPNQVLWNIDSHKPKYSLTDENITFQLKARTGGGAELQSARKTLSVQYITKKFKQRNSINDFFYVKSSIIVPSFKSEQNTAGNQKTLQFVQENIDKKSRVTVTGYSSEGEDGNSPKSESKMRARIVSDFLNSPSPPVIESSSNSTFDESLPEGRFYNKRVDIEVAKPVKSE